MAINQIASANILPSQALDSYAHPSLESRSQEKVQNTTLLTDARAHYSFPQDALVKLNNGETVPIEFLLHVLLIGCMKESSKYMEVLRKEIEFERASQKRKEENRSQQMEKVSHEVASLKTTNKVEKIATASSLAVSGVEACLTGNFVIGIPAALSGLLLSVDQYFDNKAKAGIANLLSQGNKELEANWHSRLDFITNIASLGLSFGVSGSKAFAIAKAVSQASLTGVKGTIQHRTNIEKALLLELDGSCEKTDRRLSRLMIDLEHTAAILQDYISMRLEAEERHDSLLAITLRKIK